MTVELHQLVHGYEHGHRLLAGTVALRRDEDELVTRLSDLSGAMVPGEPLVPYVTVYPLPSRTFFAVAKTWPDRDAPRTGCVLTHTLLVPMAAWKASPDVTAFASLLRFPQREATSLGPLRPSESFIVEPLTDAMLDHFIAKFFGEGIRPLVWFGADNAEAITWRVLSSLWPALRAEFSCCTLSLQPRALDDRPFDLMFAPVAARSRYGEYLGSHEVSASHHSKPEPWATKWKAQMFGGADVRDSNIADLCSGLNALPHAIRKVYLFEELRERSATAPLAAIGALDVLESLRSTESRVRVRIADLVKLAIEGAASTSMASALEMLCLLGLRLDRIDGTLIGTEIDQLLAAKVRDYFQAAPKEALAIAEDLSTRDLGRLPRPFVRGLSDALLSNIDEQKLTALASATHVGVNMLRLLPHAAAEIVIGSRRCGTSFADVIASWYEEVRDAATRRSLRAVLIPQLEQAGDASLLTELLREIEATELQDVLAHGESRVVAAELGRIYVELIGERFADEVMEWALGRHTMRRTAVAYSVAGAVPLTPSGIRSASTLDDSGFILAVVVDRAVRKSPARWLGQAAMEPAFWEHLLQDVEDDIVAGALVRLIGVLDRSAIGRARDAHVALERASRTVQVHAVREVLRDHLVGLATGDELRQWVVTTWAASVLRRDRSLLRSVIADELSVDAEQFDKVWLSAWRTLDVIGRGVPGMVDSILEICELLLWRCPVRWSSEVASVWASLLHTAPVGSPRHDVACAEALRFCFSNASLPLGPVVAEAFFTVHAAAMRDQVRPSWDLFGWTSWDKGADLRRRLVDAFSYGEWEPQWFVLAAREAWLLRKLCKRMLRQWQGKAFLQRAFEQLRSDPTSRLACELADILRDPEYAVDWD